MLCDRSKRLSDEASSLSRAWPVSMQRCTILREKRASDSSSGRRVLMTLGISLPSSTRMMKPRSAWRNTWKQIVDDLGQQRIDVEGLGQVGPQFEQHGQLVGRLRDQDVLAARRQHGLDGGGIVLFLLGLVGRAFPRATAGAAPLVIGQQVVADLDAVLILEKRAGRHLLVVDEGAVAAVQVLDVEFARRSCE